ncbi:MAG: helix-turn-helix transcriptional regulator [Saprospiraceae bacterium]|nr:helix-turn-helix transcriptional regulator [Saprospiraceae bacterium]
MDNKFFLFEHFPDCRHPAFDWEKHNEIFKKRNVIFRAKTHYSEFPEHWGCLSVKTVSTGVESFFIENEHFVLNQEKYLVLNEGQYYGSHVESEKEVESFTINFSQEFVKQAVNTLFTHDEELINNPSFETVAIPEFVQYFYNHDTIITPLIQKIKLLSDHFSANQNQIEDAYYQLFRALMLKKKEVNQLIQKTPALKKSTQIELYRRLTRAKDYIDSHFAKSISLDDIAQVACLSTFHFLTCFKALHGLTPYQYLTRVRLQQAKKLLKTKDISVQEVCQMVGYEDISSFSKLYKKTFGASPSKTEKILTD